MYHRTKITTFTFAPLLDVLSLIAGQHRDRIAFVGILERPRHIRKHHIETAKLFTRAASQTKKKIFLHFL